MLSKSFIASVFLLTLTSSVNAHAAISPALGVKGNPVRNDVQRPSNGKPCGNVNIAQNIDTSTPVVADANGTFSASITNFNPGADGSRSIKTVQVDASGTGNNLVAAKMLVNGDAAPASDSTQQLTVQLPAGTTCAGGAGKDLCIASFTTTAGGKAGNSAPSRAANGVARAYPSGAAKGVKRATPEDRDVSSPATPETSNEAQKDKVAGDKALNNNKKKGGKNDKKKGGKNDKKKGKNDKKKAAKDNKGSKRHCKSCFFLPLVSY
ncbi:hypothetical protein BJV78DRAFT_1213598 [Lactifluus subvellereus]|nr:hypothetical protein BJV78DRAFT_1213598 [Lactifluus subvellereus]